MVQRLRLVLSQNNKIMFNLAVIIILMILNAILPIYVNVLLWIGYLLSHIVRYTRGRFLFTLALLVGTITSAMNLILTHQIGYSLYVSIPTAVIMLTVIGVMIIEIATFFRKKDLAGILYATTAILFLAFFEVMFTRISVTNAGAVLSIYETVRLFSITWIFHINIEHYLLIQYAILFGTSVIMIVMKSLLHHHGEEISHA